VANVFISHTGADVEWAEQICRWLHEDGHNVFLDVDKRDGVSPGDDWEALLYERLHWADAVVCVVTPAYLQSVWCAAEIGAARALGSELLPVRVTSEPLDDQLLTLKQYVDAARDASDARDRLRSSLRNIDGTGGRGWPENKSPYPGLRAFELGEHRVYFGRSAEIKRITERLRSPAERGVAEVLTIVGPSGCGKSSLLRAGVLPRVASEDYWLPLVPILPGTDPIGSLARALAALIRDRGIGVDVTALRTDLQCDGLRAVATDLLLAAGVAVDCKVLLVIDQFEELLTQTEPDERAKFVAILQPSLGGPVQALATLRPEFLDAASRDADLSKLPLRMLQVRPLESGALRSVIEMPAKVAGLRVDDELTTRLVADTGNGDALPLLAYTLEQLAHGLTREGHLSHQRYIDIGGVQGALECQADAALHDACTKFGARSEQVVAELLNLVTIDEQGRPTKRRVALDDLSADATDMLGPFISRRLLSTAAEGDRTFVCVAHEAFLVSWPPLNTEIDAQTTALRARRVVENAAADWAAGGRDASALLQGRQLAKSTVDTGAVLRHASSGTPNMYQEGKRIGVPRHWRPRRRRQLVTRVELDQNAKQFLEASIRKDRVRRYRRATQVAAVIMILATATVVSVLGFVQAREQTQRATAAKLIGQSRAMLSGATAGGDRRAILQMLAAEALDPGSDPGAMLDTLIDDRGVTKIITTPSQDNAAVAVSPDDREIVSGGSDNMLHRWDYQSGAALGLPLAGHTDRVYTVAYSNDGRWIASGGADKTARIWDAHSGAPIRVLTGHDGYVWGVAFSPDNSLLATASQDGTIRLWSTATGEPVGVPIRGHDGKPVTAVQFTTDGTWLASAGMDGTVRLWGVYPDPHHPTPRILTTVAGPVSGVAISPDGKRVASVDYVVNPGVVDAPPSEGAASKLAGTQLRITDIATGQAVDSAMEYGYGAESIAFSPDGTTVAVGTDDRKIRLHDARTGAVIGQPLIGQSGKPSALVYSVDGGRIISSGDGDYTVRVWSADPEQSVAKSVGVFASSGPTPISPDGSIVATRDPHRASDIALWRADTGERLRTIVTGHNKFITALAWRPDGQAIATADAEDNAVNIWSAQTGAPVGSALAGPADLVSALSFSGDGNRIAAGGLDGAVWLWNLRGDSARPLRLTGSAGAVLVVGFSADGGELMAMAPAHQASDDFASEDITNVFSSPVMVTPNSVRVWNTDTGVPVGPPLNGKSGTISEIAFDFDNAPIASAAITPDGKQILISTSTELRLQDVVTGKAVGKPWLAQGQPFGGPVAISSDGRYAASADVYTHDIQLWDARTGGPIGKPLQGHRREVLSAAFGGGNRSIVTSGADGLMIWPAPLGWRDALCSKLTSNMTKAEWDQWVSPAIKYQKVCPSLPSP
jgi:WD40 repeat protein